MKTMLAEKHKALGAKMVDFSGWEMPVSYKGVIAEHHAVRHQLGIFDVSHMGLIEVQGKQAETFLDYLSTNRILGKPNFSATYTILCQEDGGCVDDVIIYKSSPESLFLVANASNREKDLHYLKTKAGEFGVDITSHFDKEGILALQGPKAMLLMEKLAPQACALKPMHFMHSKSLMISTTGYTGSGGFEVYGPQECLMELWDFFLAEGKTLGIEPCGLGARDTLRLEMGYALYGHEISETIAPTESVSAWTVKWDREFVGKKALSELEHSDKKRREYGVILEGQGIAREGYKVFSQGKELGVITSGSYSPSLQKAIAIALVKGNFFEGDLLEVGIRDRLSPARVVQVPFYRI